MNETRIKVLLVEDDPDDATLVRDMLGEAPAGEFDLKWVDRFDDGQKAVAKGECDVVLLDLGLPDRQGLSTLAGMRSSAPEVPIVVLTGFDDQATAIKALHSGAQDYLVKGQDTADSLARSIRYAVERQRLESILENSLQWEQQSWARLQAMRDYRHYVSMSRDGASGGGGVESDAAELPAPDEQALMTWVPDYSDLVHAYARADRSSEQRPLGRLRQLAERLADVKARARDVVRLHLSALGDFSKQSEAGDQQTFLTASRLVLVELLGVLADIYLRANLRARVTGGEA